MNLKAKHIIYLLILILGSFTLAAGQKPTRQSASDAFSDGNFELAYSRFTELLSTYPRDPLYKYYSAACLVNLKRDPGMAEDLIEQALNSGSLKSLPDDAIFYLARTKHLQGKFDEAAKTYNRFTAQAGKKRAKDLDVPAYIQECKEHTGDIRDIKAEEKPVPEEIQEVSRKQVLPESLDTLLGEKLEIQYRSDSAEAVAKARQINTSIETPPAGSGADTGLVAKGGPIPVQAPVMGKDTVLLPDDGEPVSKQVVYDVAEVKDTTIKIREILNRPAAVLSVFEVLPQPVTDPKAVIEVNPEPPEGLIYRIQIAVFRNPVQLSYFKGVSPIYGIKASGATVTYYYAGLFRQHVDAAKALLSVKSKGFKDAFVIAQMNNKNISAERAEILEQEWGAKPLFSIDVNTGTESIDTIPPTLLLKVEVTRSIQPLREEAIEPMRVMAGKRSFDMLTLENGSVAYLIGNFITFESAEDFAGLLRRNGYRDAKVVAWLGKREIDIETAKQLFETLK